jgi:hypothetical protein
MLSQNYEGSPASIIDIVILSNKVISLLIIADRDRLKSHNLMNAKGMPF